MTMTARLSPCEQYRYRLRREWVLGDPFSDKPGKFGGYNAYPHNAVAFLMLNPSTADHTVNDPTVRRCIDFAYRWGYGALEVVNLFALRSTDPKALYLPEAAPVGAGNDGAIIDCAREVSMVVCAWGTHGALMNRGDQVIDFLRSMGLGFKLHHLGLTKDGHPKHPLYLKADTVAMPFPPSGREGDNQ